jgi:hypothetical protein
MTDNLAAGHCGLGAFRLHWVVEVQIDQKMECHFDCSLKMVVGHDK